MKTNSRYSPLPLLLIILFFLVGCRVNRPDDVLSPRRMESYLYDYHLAQAIAKELPNSEHYQRDLLFNWAYMKNGVTKEQVDASLIWYTRYPKEFSKVYDKLSTRIENDRSVSASLLEKVEKKSFSVLSGDSVDLWYLNRVNLLLSSAYLDRISFNVAIDTSFYLGDAITWNIKNTFFGQDSDSILSSGYFSISVYYPDSISTIDSIIKLSSTNTFSLVLDDSIVPKDIKGFVTYLDSTKNRKKSMLLTDISLIRQHIKKHTISKSSDAENN